MKDPNGIVEEVTLAEAAAWLVRLQRAERQASDDAAFREWLRVSPAHARAFARMTDIWEAVPGSVSQVAPVQSRFRPLLRFPLPLTAALASLLILAAWWWAADNDVYRTDVGEQHAFILEDGTRVVLNTDSQLRVSYDDKRRLVELERGEALFEVRRQVSRPFMVRVGRERVTALGTTFVVRRDADHLAVSLLEGRVEVESVEAGSADGSSLPEATVLEPGQRLTLSERAGFTLDHPRMDSVTAWRHGELVLDDVSLEEAIGEFQRYGATGIRLEDPELAKLRISGIFNTGDSAEFASAVAELHGLEAGRDKATIWLGSRPGRD